MRTNILYLFFFGIVKELRSYAQQARKQSHSPNFLAQFFWKLLTYEHKLSLLGISSLKFYVILCINFVPSHFQNELESSGWSGIFENSKRD